MRSRTTPAFGCLLVAGLIASASAVATAATIATSKADLDSIRSSAQSPIDRRAVIVAADRLDLTRAISAVGQWSTSCQSAGLHDVDLVVILAEWHGSASVSKVAEDKIAGTAGRCFAETRVVYGHLVEKVIFRRRGERLGACRFQGSILFFLILISYHTIVEKMALIIKRPSVRSPATSIGAGLVKEATSL